MWPPLPRNYLPLSYENMNKLSKATTTNTEAAQQRERRVGARIPPLAPK